MDLPLVSVIFVTYKRIDLLKRTLASFLENTDYPRYKLELILCDDGSPKAIQSEMKKMGFDKFLFSNKNHGMAYNSNKGIKSANGNYILQLQDDWICKGPTDYLRLGIKALNEHKRLGIVRFRLGLTYLYSAEGFNNGFNQLRLINFDQGDTLKSIHHRKDTFIYSDNPHLKHKKVHEILGLYKNYRSLSKTEIEFCKRFNKSKEFFVGYIKDYESVFEHIGEQQSFRQSSIGAKIRNRIANFRKG